jgi:hypothetical protein
MAGLHYAHINVLPWWCTERAIEMGVAPRADGSFGNSERPRLGRTTVRHLFAEADADGIVLRDAPATPLGRINDHNIHSLDQPLPWNWTTQPVRLAAG